MMNVAIRFCSTPKPAMIGAAIIAGGCATFPFNVTIGTALVLAGFAITVIALSILQASRNMEEASKNFIKKMEENRKQKEEKTREDTSKIRGLVEQLLSQISEENWRLKYLKGVNERLASNCDSSCLESLLNDVKKLIKNASKFGPYWSCNVWVIPRYQEIDAIIREYLKELENPLNEMPKLIEPNEQRSCLKEMKEKLEKFEDIINQHQTLIQNFNAVLGECEDLKEQINDRENQLDLLEKIEKAVEDYNKTPNPDSKASEPIPIIDLSKVLQD